MRRLRPYLKLPFSFDLARLQQDLARLETSTWIAHFNTRAYESRWSCLPLRAIDGRIDHVIPLEEGRYQDTPLLALCPYFAQVIRTFQCEKTSIRLMSLAPGGVIKPHRDAHAALEDGVARLHIPIQTTPDVLFQLEGEPVHFTAGDAWYLNASCLHGVTNGSSQPRIHLMMDCLANDWLEQVFRASGWVPRPAHRYPDPTISDDNVGVIIAQLRAQGSETSLSLAASLEAIRTGAVPPNDVPAARPNIGPAALPDVTPYAE